MTQGKRADLSAAQRTDIWGRWKAGQSLHEIGRAFGLPIRRFTVCCRITAGLFQQRVGAHC